MLKLPIFILFACSFISANQLFAQSEISIGDPSDTLEMRASQNIYRRVISYEPYESTCYREVSNGTRTECRSVNETHCTKVPYECHQESVDICEEVPDTTTESYPCTEYKEVVSYEYDYSVAATITVVKNESAKNFDLSKCSLVAELGETSETYSAVCKSAIVRLQTLERNEVMNGRNKERSIKVALDFADISGLDALKEGISRLSFAKGILSFTAADLHAAENFTLNLKLIRNRFIIKDIKLIDQELKAADFTSTAQADGNFVISIDLKKMAPKFDSTRKNTASIVLKTLRPVDVKGAINSPSLTNELTETLVINERKN